MEYFKKNNNLNINVYNYELIFKNYNKYKLLICGTTDYTSNIILKLMKNNKNKLITVFHTKKYLEMKNYFFNNIVYTPKCLLNQNCNYILPIHNLIDKTKKDMNIKKLVIIGQFKYKDIDNYNNLINNIDNYNNLEIHICIRNKDMIGISNNSDKINMHIGLNFFELKELLDKSHFILPLSQKNGHYHNNTMSGSLPLSLNHNIPLITDNITKKIFNLNHSITYEDSILEIFDKVNNMTHEEYNNILDNLQIDKEQILNYSKNKFMEIIKKYMCV